MSALSRFTYSTMVGLCYQSLHSNQLMTHKILSMATESEQAASLSSLATKDEALSQKLAEEATLDETEAEAFLDQAAVLQDQSLRDEALAEGDYASANELKVQMSQEEAQLEAHTASAAEEQTIVEEETAKANTEVAEAAADYEEFVSDGYATAACEWIPFVDVVCDVVGGIAAVGLETAASKLSIQSGLDYSLAAAAEVKEKKDLAAVATLQSAFEKDSALELELETKAEEEEAKAQAEEAEAVKDRAAAKAKTEESEQEVAASEAAAAEAETEEMESSEQLEQSIQDGVAAFWHAFVSGVSSTIALLFFGIRFLTAVVIPGGEVLVGFVSLNLLSQAFTRGTDGLAVASGAVTSSPAVQRGLVGRTWDALPKRQVSYFTLHCGVFVTTMAFYCPKFQAFETFDLRSKGGIILIFACSAAVVQILFLHAFEKLFIKIRSTSVDAATVSDESRCEAFMETCLHFFSLTSLFVMECLGIWLLFGQCAFMVHTPWGPFFLALVLVATCALYHYIISKTRKQEEEEVENAIATAIAIATEESICEESPLLSNETSDYKISFHERTLSEDLSLDTGSSLNTHHESTCRDVDDHSLHKDPPETDEEKSWYAYFASGACPDFSIKNEGISCASSTTVNQSVMTPPSLFHRYVATLQLPFEILVMTCMFVLIQKCAPVILKLWAHVIESHGPLVIGGCGALVLLISWCSFSNKGGDRINVDLWTGSRSA